jgi:hypothetical protein
MKIKKKSQVSWYMPVIPALGWLRQEHREFEAGLGYISMTLSQNSFIS